MTATANDPIAQLGSFYQNPMSDALAAGDRSAVRSLCARSFTGARDLFEICSPSMLAMMEAMMAAPGVIGARQAGGGFGGCMVAFVEADKTDAFAALVARRYREETGLTPDVFAVAPADGAGVMSGS